MSEPAARAESDGDRFLIFAGVFNGDALVWWADPSGYTADVNAAKRFSRDDALRLARPEERERVVPERKAIATVRHVVWSSDFHRIVSASIAQS